MMTLDHYQTRIREMAHEAAAAVQPADGHVDECAAGFVDCLDCAQLGRILDLSTNWNPASLAPVTDGDAVDILRGFAQEAVAADILAAWALLDDDPKNPATLFAHDMSALRHTEGFTEWTGGSADWSCIAFLSADIPDGFGGCSRLVIADAESNTDAGLPQWVVLAQHDDNGSNRATLTIQPGLPLDAALTVARLSIDTLKRLYGIK